MNQDNAVYIKRCEDYDRPLIRGIVKEGMRELGFAPWGKVFVKPNVVVAHNPAVWGIHPYTAVELVGSSLLALAEAPGVERIDLGEKCGIGFSTRMCFSYAGYFDEIARVNREAKVPVEIFCIDEVKRDPVFIGGRVHDVLRVARPMARADCKVYLPKLKCHCVSKVTGAVKLNVGICSDDERSIRHDFLLDDKIVDLLAAGRPDFTVMDAVTIGVGNEGFPIPRKLGLIIMSRNPISADLVGSRLLGYGVDDVPYLKRAVERGYGPARVEDVEIAGDLKSLDDVDEAAKRIGPRDEEFFRWQDVNTELKRLNSPMRFYWGPYREGGTDKCLTGCVMGFKMFLAAFEKYAGAEEFTKSKPVVFVIGKVDEEIDVKGSDAFIFGTCGRANLKNARKVVHLDKCFTTVADMMMQCGAGLGMRSPIRDLGYLLPVAGGVMSASARKLVKGRYLQDMGHFLGKTLQKKI